MKVYCVLYNFIAHVICESFVIKFHAISSFTVSEGDHLELGLGDPEELEYPFLPLGESVQIAFKHNGRVVSEHLKRKAYLEMPLYGGAPQLTVLLRPCHETGKLVLKIYPNAKDLI